jgi:hypothetical protein
VSAEVSAAAVAQVDLVQMKVANAAPDLPRDAFGEETATGAD